MATSPSQTVESAKSTNLENVHKATSPAYFEGL
jgi:hypothetical protein